MVTPAPDNTPPASSLPLPFTGPSINRSPSTGHTYTQLLSPSAQGRQRFHFYFCFILVQGGCNRGSKQDFFIGEEALLAYSPHLDEAFCVPIPCVPFVNRTTRHNLQSLINKSFNIWWWVANVIKDHAGKHYHMDAITKQKLSNKQSKSLGQRYQTNLTTRKSRTSKPTELCYPILSMLLSITPSKV